MLDYAEIKDDETWELFARDYLEELGFKIIVPPGRGADQGRDLLISEQMTGLTRKEEFTWLVSCKYFTVSGKSVGTGEEANITDRMAHHKADGFIGFYSTVPSASLVDRLKEYRGDGRIKAFEIYDRKRIEASFYGAGLSKIALRYFPTSYGKMRPIQKLIGDYIPLECEICKKDVLQDSIANPYSAIMVIETPLNDINRHDDVYIACKGACDHELQDRLKARGAMSAWQDIGDLTNPVFYLKNMMGYMNQLHEGRITFSDQAHEHLKQIYIALAQRTLRDVTEEDAERFKDTLPYDGF